MAAEPNILPPRYRDPETIGRGGMGEIYRATDTVLGRDVAVKLLAERYAGDEDVRARFTREALAAARLSGHKHAITIFDVGEWLERPFIVMEYLAGGSLEDVLREEGAQPPDRALAWISQAGEALDEAHAEGVVHRDVKPANLLLNDAGQVHVADFGIASAAGLDSFTRPGTVLGTAGYLSPEQARGERAGPESDRYALAIVAFELLTGTRPFASDSPTAEASAHVNAPVPAASSRNPDLPPAVDAVLARALAKEPAERPPSSAALVGELQAALRPAGAGATTRAVVGTRPLHDPTGPAPGAAGGGRRTALAALAVAVLLSAGVLGAIALARGDGDEGSPATGETGPGEPTTLVTTIVTTEPGTTQEVTVTAEAPPPPPPEEEEPPDEPDGGGGVNEGIALTDESTAMIRNGAYGDALPVAQRGLELLSGSGHIYEAYANYNVGKALLETGQCAEAIPYFDRSEQIQGRRGEIQRDRNAAERCA